MIDQKLWYPHRNIYNVYAKWMSDCVIYRIRVYWAKNNRKFFDRVFTKKKITTVLLRKREAWFDLTDLPPGHLATKGGRVTLAATLRSNYGTYCSFVSVTHLLRDVRYVMWRHWSEREATVAKAQLCVDGSDRIIIRIANMSVFQIVNRRWIGALWIFTYPHPHKIKLFTKGSIAWISRQPRILDVWLKNNYFSEQNHACMIHASSSSAFLS